MTTRNAKSKSYELNRDQAPAFWQVDILWQIVADASQTGGALTVIEQVCPKGSGPAPHMHEQQESFYILEGQLTALVDGNELVAKQGSFLNVAPNTVHSFRVDSETCRLLNIYTPGGFERIITELGTPAPARTLPPRGLPMKGTREDAVRVSKAIGMSWPANAADVLRPNGPG